MKVYYFTSQTNALNNIKNHRIKISQIDDLNDPYEWHGIDLRDAQLRKSFKEGIKSVKDDFGLICFSASWQNPLMWSHYGDKHKGICLGFDVASEHVQAVAYTKTVTKTEQDPYKFVEYLENGGIDKLLTLKYEDWSYEQELRVIVPIEQMDAETKLYFCDFSESLVLTDVILGHRCNLQPSEFKQYLSDYNSDVRVFKSRIAFGDFKVVPKLDIREYYHFGKTPSE